MAKSSRIEDLQRRIQKDPASIAFAQLAEEHRRAGQFEEAVRVCRTGLAHHPAYLSARITLGRALLEMARYDEAVTEFEYVLKAAPDNLTAVRGLAEIEQRRRATATSLITPVVAPELATNQEPTTNQQRPTTNQQRPTTNQTAVDPVVAELEAWLAVITQERAARVAGV